MTELSAAFNPIVSLIERERPARTLPKMFILMQLVGAGVGLLVVVLGG